MNDQPRLLTPDTAPVLMRIVLEKTATNLDQLWPGAAADPDPKKHLLMTALGTTLKILASEKMGALTPQQLKVLESIQSSVARLTRIVDNLADFASLQSGESPLFLGEVEPDALSEAVVADLVTSEEFGACEATRIVLTPVRVFSHAA